MTEEEIRKRLDDLVKIYSRWGFCGKEIREWHKLSEGLSGKHPYPTINQLVGCL